MSKPRYKRGRRSTRFKNLADGLRIGVSQQEAATTRITEQLKQTQRQQAFGSQNFISGFESTAMAEWRNLKEIQQFKSDKRQHLVDAITTRNKTDLERLDQEVKLKQGEYEYWKDLSPKMAKAARAFVEGGLRFGDMLHGMIEWEREDVQERIDNTALPQQKLNFTLSKENLDQKEKLSQNGNVELARTHDKSGLKLSSYWAQRKLFKLVRENKTLYKNLIIESWNKDNGEKYQYQENNAMEVMDFGARALLNEFGISHTSSAGKELILEFRKIGLLDANHKADQRKAKETSESIEQSLDILETILANPNSTQSEKNLALNDLVWTIENGYYIKDGKVLNPNNAQQRLSKADSGITAFRYLADRNLPYFNSRAEYEEFFGNMVIPGEILEWTTDQDISDPAVPSPGSVTWRTKLGPRYEKEVMGYIDKMLEAKATANDLKRKTDGNIAYTQEQANRQKLIDEGVDITSQEFLFKKWDEISKLPIDETSRENLYALYGYNHKDIQNLDLYKAFKTAESEGDEYQMVRLINGLGEGKAKKALQNNLRVHRQIVEYGGHKKLNKNISLIIGGDGTSDYEGSTILTPSGKDARDFFTARVIQALKNDPNLTVEKAIEEEQKEFDKGSGLGASGIYRVARRPGNAKKGKYYYNFMGDNEKKYNMVNTYLISPVEAVLHAKDLGLDLGNPTIDDAQALKILHSTNYESWTIEDLNRLAQVFAVPGETPGKLDFEEGSKNEDILFNLLYDARFIAPKPVKTIADRIINKSELNIEKNFPELAKKVDWYKEITGKSKKEIYDLLFKNYNIKDANDNFVTFPLQQSDVDNSSDTKDNNQEASTLINAVKEETGKTPISKTVDLQVSGGLSKYEAFFKLNNISYQVAVNNEFVTDWEGIINSNGLAYVKDIDMDLIYNAFFGYQYNVNYTNLGNLTPKQAEARAKELGITPKEFKNRIRGSK